MTNTVTRGGRLSGRDKYLRDRQLISPQQVAKLAGLAPKTVYNMSSNGEMPPAYRFGSRVRYSMSDVEVWLEERRA